MRGRWTRVRGGLTRVGALVGGMALLASGCYLAVAEEHERVSPGTRPWFCNASGDGTPASGHGNGSHVHAAYAGMVKGPLPWDECKQLAAQLDAAWEFARKWPTKGQAQTGGWTQVAQYIATLGTHHVKELRLTSTTFDPAQPNFLIFGGSLASAPLVGLAYGVTNTSGSPPAGFAGNNDWFHLHRTVCMAGLFNILAGAEEISNAECTRLGGSQFPLNAFLLHLWILPGYEYRVDLFSSSHPCLQAHGPAPSGDPCWADAWRDPATIPPSPPHEHPPSTTIPG
jgi:hypothetical protein